MSAAYPVTSAARRQRCARLTAAPPRRTSDFGSHSSMPAYSHGQPVLARYLGSETSVETALAAFMQARYERCRMVVEVTPAAGAEAAHAEAAAVPGGPHA